MTSTPSSVPAVPAPPSLRRGPFGPLAAVAVGAGLFLASLVVALALGFASLRLFGFPSWDSLFEWTGEGGAPVEEFFTVVGLVEQAALAALVLAVARRRYGPAHRTLLGLVPRRAGAALRPCFVALLVLMGAEALLLEAYPDLIEPYDLPASPLGRALGFGLLVIGAPLSEELLFRGFLHGNLRARFRPAATLLVTAALFALVHFDGGWAYPLVVFPSGLLLGYARERSGSLWPSVAMHGCFNVVAYVDALWRSL